MPPRPSFSEMLCWLHHRYRESLTDRTVRRLLSRDHFAIARSASPTIHFVQMISFWSQGREGYAALPLTAQSRSSIIPYLQPDRKSRQHRREFPSTWREHSQIT